jgi:hypothetical protein
MSNNAVAAPFGTRAHTPDLDWSQVRETVLMLQLSVGQIEAAMREGNNSVDVLTQSFTTMAEYLRGMSNDVLTLPDNPECAALKQQLSANAVHLTSMVQRAIIAFQFYDKLVQRLSHVSNGLDGLSDVIREPSRLYNPDEWAHLQGSIRARYSTAEELRMFEDVMKGATVAEALENFQRHKQPQATDGDVELF